MQGAGIAPRKLSKDLRAGVHADFDPCVLRVCVERQLEGGLGTGELDFLAKGLAVPGYDPQKPDDLLLHACTFNVPRHAYQDLEP